MKNISNQILKVVSKEFSVDLKDISFDTGPGDLIKWDSLGSLRLVMSIEKEFNIQLSIDDIVTVNNIKDLIKVVSNLLKVDEKDFNNKRSSLTSNKISDIIRFPKIVYSGLGSLNSLSSIDLDTVAIITGPSSYANEIADKVERQLENVKFRRFLRSKGEPKEKDIKGLASKLKKFSPKKILAIGGGSTIDIAKLAWLIYEQPDYNLGTFDNGIQDLKLRKKASFVAIPTTFGSGSEASSAAAFTRNNEIKKTILVSHDFLPDYVILDPELGLSASNLTLFSSAFDALTHAIEGYVSIIDKPLLNPIAIIAMKEIIKVLDYITEKNIDIKHLETLCNAAYYAGIIQNHCSVGLTLFFAHQLTSYGVNHGTAVAIFLAPVIEFNSNRSEKYSNLIKEMGFKSINELINKISSTLNKSKICPNNKIINKIVKNKSLIVDSAMMDVTFRTNPIAPSKHEVEAIFDNAIKKINRYE